MSTLYKQASPLSVQGRRQICSVLTLLTLGTWTGVMAQPAVTSRPALERFIQTANLIQQCRLWAMGGEKFAKTPKHPFYPLVVQIRQSNESELLAFLIQTFQGLTEEEANELVATLETPLGQWVVQASLWSRKSVLSQTNPFSGDSSKTLGNGPRRLSNKEIQEIKALGDTPHWQALRRVSRSSLLGDELIMVLDWPQFVDLLPDTAQP